MGNISEIQYGGVTFFFVYTHIDYFFFCSVCLSFVALAWVRIQHIYNGKNTEGQRSGNEKSIVIQSLRQKGREYWSWGLTGALESYSQ